MNKDLEKDIHVGLSVEDVFQSWHIQTGSGYYLLKEKSRSFPPPLYFNKTPVEVCYTRNILRLFLDKKLNFQNYIKEKKYKSK